ncbi:MAG: hypothetical protein ACMUEM_02435 [Flavobacteriales bacterium AspAUS03]
MSLSIEREEKEKSCTKKEKEEQGDLNPSDGLNGDLGKIGMTREKKNYQIGS